LSATKLSRFSRFSLAGAVLLIAASLLLSVTQARAETVKGRLVSHVTKEESIEVGDVPGHVLGVVEYKGLVFFENGEVATISEVETFEATKGSFTFQIYSTLAFEDGSTQIMKGHGTSTPQEGKPELAKGTCSYIRGTGRFEGIKGSGSWSGKWFESIATYYGDFTWIYTLPKK